MKTTLRWGRWLVVLLWLGIGTQPAVAQVYYIDISDQTLSLPNRTFSVEQVLDGRQDRAGIGRVHTGLLDAAQPAEPPSKLAQGALSLLQGRQAVQNQAARPAQLRPNLVDGLTAFLQARLPHRPTDEPLLVLVRELRIGEQGGGSGNFSPSPIGQVYTPGQRQEALARVTLDCYLHRSDGYHLLRTVTDTTSAKRANATALHAANLALALEHCLAQLSGADRVTAATRPARTLADLQQVGRLAGSLDYAVLTDSVRPRGYYPTFLDFRNNKPIPTPTLAVETKPRTAPGTDTEPEILPYFTEEGHRRPLPGGVWGFSDGQELYVFHHRRFVKLRRTALGFDFTSLPDADQQLLRSGDLLGAALASAANRHPVNYSLDLVSGRATQFADAGRAAGRRDTIVLCVYRTGAKTDGPVELLLNEQAVGELADNSFLALPWTDQTHEPHLRLAEVAGPELTFIPSFQRTVYIKVVAKPGADPARPALERVPAKEGEFDLRQIKLRQQLDEKKRSRSKP